MKSRRILQVVTLILGASLSVPGLAAAQNVAADMIRNSMAAAGVTSGFTVKSVEDYPSYGNSLNILEFRGLRLSSAFVQSDSGPGWGMIRIVENLSDAPYCIRPKSQDLPVGEDSRVQTVNQIVDPGRTLMIIGIRDSGYLPSAFSARTAFAFWRPNYDAPEGSWCRSNAPEGLQAWLASPGVQWFLGSRP